MNHSRAGQGTDRGPHIPVLGSQAVELLNVRAEGVYIDATFGAGGYSRAILEIDGAQVIGLDRDRTAIAGGAALVEEAKGRLVLAQTRFSDLDAMARELGHDVVDGVVLDIGVSSMQLDTAERGFSFRFEGPLDMRMGGEGPTAADVVARASERDLAAIIAMLGEERFARPIARAIVAARKNAPIETTRALVDVIARVLHPRPGQIHPATRTFQALRIFVNEELAELQAALAAAERILKPSGRLVVVSFHSLEDRIVKGFLNARGRVKGFSRHQPLASGPEPTFRILTGRPVIADADEIAANPRARSAKLRAAERTAAPARDEDDETALPRLPSLDQVMEDR